MSRTTLCVLTAALLAVLSLAMFFTRQQVMGEEVKVPLGPGTWKVTLMVTGRMESDARLMTATPLDFGRQHVVREACHSDEFLDKPPDARHPDRRQVIWTRRAGVHDGPFRVRYEFYCSPNVARPSAPMSELAQSLYGPPRPGEYLGREPTIDNDHPAIAALARRLTEKIERPEDQVEALFRFVEQKIASEPSVAPSSTSASECLKHKSGDAAAKARLLTALCRNRGVPARMVTGLSLSRGNAQAAHHWVEVWERDQWLPMCPVSHHFGWVPRTYLVFAFGDRPIVRGRHVQDLDYAFLMERANPAADATKDSSWLRRAFTALSFFALPPTEQRLVEFLLLLPIAALIVCLFRNIIGMNSFGTFAPALLGLSFRELHSMPGILVFTAIVLAGWLIRRALDRYHLLQVPRMAVMLSLVVLVLIGAIIAANHQNMPATRYVSLFPMVILVGMIERFWTLETEDGTTSSFRTLLQTLVIVAVISLVLSWHMMLRYLFRYPELIGVVMAVQLLIGRYTGYRLMELWRFRDFLNLPGSPGAAAPGCAVQG